MYASSTSSASPRNSVDRDRSISQNSSPKSSSISRLWQKLSPRRALDKPSFPSDSDPSAAAAATTTSNQHTDNSLVILERVFEYFDEDGDGRVSEAELQRCLHTVGRELSPEEAETAVRASDCDGDGILGFDEFVRMVEGGGEEERAVELREAFGMYAVEGTEYITPKSLKKMLSRLGESTSVDSCKDMIRKFDINGDGVLNFDEFRIMMR